jgi:hypothetical protein
MLRAQSGRTMKVLVQSAGEIDNFSPYLASPMAEPTIVEEVAAFRAGIALWAATQQVERQDGMRSADGCQKASAKLQGWSHEYFRAIKRASVLPRSLS